LVSHNPLQNYEFNDALFDDFERVEVKEKPLKYDEFSDVLIYSCDEGEGNKEDEVMDFCFS
jgi:hypothetical protein